MLGRSEHGCRQPREVGRALCSDTMNKNRKQELSHLLQVGVDYLGRDIPGQFIRFRASDSKLGDDQDQVAVLEIVSPLYGVVDQLSLGVNGRKQELRQVETINVHWIVQHMGTSERRNMALKPKLPQLCLQTFQGAIN